jgi:allantoate deiminase
MAGHAGTVPMSLRRDALAAAAECVLAVERIGGAMPSSSAPSAASRRSPARSTSSRRGDVHHRRSRAAGLAARRCGQRRIREVRKISRKGKSLRHRAPAVARRRGLRAAPDAQMERAVARRAFACGGCPPARATTAWRSRLADICMLFVRCKDGISHNPAESITAADAGAGAAVLLEFIEKFQ